MRWCQAALRATDPFYHPPPPLWWLPKKLPPRLRLIATLSEGGPYQAATMERLWDRTALPAPVLPATCLAGLVEAALSRSGTSQVRVRWKCVCLCGRGVCGFSCAWIRRWVLSPLPSDVCGRVCGRTRRFLHPNARWPKGQVLVPGGTPAHARHRTVFPPPVAVQAWSHCHGLEFRALLDRAVTAEEARGVQAALSGATAGLAASVHVPGMVWVQPGETLRVRVPPPPAVGGGGRQPGHQR